MTDRVSVLLPTRGRYKALGESLISLAETTDAKKLIDLIIVADNDPRAAGLVNNFFALNGYKFHNVMLIESRERLYSVKAFNWAFDHIHTEYFCWVTNTLKYESDWLINALHLFRTTFLEDVGVLSLGKKNKANYGISSKAFVHYNRGEWFSLKYKMNFCDDELAARAILLGRYKHLPNSGLISNSERVNADLLYKDQKEKTAFKKIDRGLFYKRSENNFGLPEGRIYPWEGFRDVNFMLKEEM